MRSQSTTTLKSLSFGYATGYLRDRKSIPFFNAKPGPFLIDVVVSVSYGEAEKSDQGVFMCSPVWCNVVNKIL